MSPKAYMAGPDVFLQNSGHIFNNMRTMCQKYGIKALIPEDGDVFYSNPLDINEELSLQIFKKNVNLINQCDFVVANLEPFRGPSADAGTIWEVGYAFAQHKKIFAYTSNSNSYFSKIDNKKPFDKKEWVDSNGMIVENFNLFDNLMIVHAIDSVYEDLESLLSSKKLQDFLQINIF